MVWSAGRSGFSMADEDVSGSQQSSSVKLDPEVIQGLCELGEASGEDLLAELLHMFLTELPTRLRVIVDAVSASDLVRLEREAHSLKSSARALGALSLGEICAALELAGRQGNLDGAGQAIPVLQTELIAVEQAMQSLLAKHPKS